MDTIIEIKDLVKRYKKAELNAVDHISLTIREGEFFAFLGPNGAGKTTTISILNTTLSKTAGEVTVAGYDLDRQQNQVRRSIGIIFQRPSLDLNLTAEENVRFHAVLYGLYPFRPTYSLMDSSYKQRMNELADVIGLKGEIFKPVKTFSGGMKRKLEIVRSLMHHPRILFLDEPTSGLDPASRKNLWQYLKEVRHKERTTIFLTTHYLDEAEETDRVCIINHGKVVRMGTPDEIKESLTQPYLLIDAKDRTALLQELQHKHIPYTEKEYVRVPVTGTTTQQVIQQIQTPLSVLKIHSPTLEDAYLQIIDHKS